ncbi:MAG TPA: glutathione S-transferase N-terminal domain-containing protein [Rhodopila sp.]|uniref:glutathione S-transferase N-terminal domain-containing protein n=1 Tax=Rhodopila sp. TaxID=2480087 RepID=UPI002BDC4325|nr:glutathione S-transferase N-terminal domain-containing protein [Rhodopila sp.]HVY17749.1 glutathione S-transferase N-terminal domain-containing protein [Rhodopila sp.]
MKLYYSPTSPYVRKVMACAIIRGLDGRIEKHATNPHESPADLVADNPLSKVPCLVTDDGMSLFGSQLICEYLDSLGDALPLFPEIGAVRWRALKFQSLGDGILDAAVPGRGELQKPKEAARDALIARYKTVIRRTVDVLEADPPHRHVDIGSITVACALGYLDFRYADEPWRPGHAKLAAWYESFVRNKGIAETAPG